MVYCAVKVYKGGPQTDRMSFGGGVLLPEQQSETAERNPEPVEVGA
jgi:hypothetical protein